MDLLELVQQSQGGDEESFTEICRRFGGLVKKHAFQPHLRPVADEAQCQGWLAVAEAVKSYDSGSGVPVAGYIESKVRFALWNLFKRERRRWQTELALEQGHDDDDEQGGLLAVIVADDDVAAMAERTELARELHAAILSLPERQRLAIVYTVLDDVALKEAACRLGVSLQAVHSLRERGLKNLRKTLKRACSWNVWECKEVRTWQ